MSPVVKRSAIRRAGTVTAALLGLSLVTACSPSPQANTDPTTNLEIVSWWTSSSEQAALDSLLNAYRAAHPDVEVSNAAAAGGAGSAARVVLAKRLADNDPPDIWQTFPNGALDGYVSRGQVADATEVLQSSGMAAALPQVILDGLTDDGRQYGVPTSSHRGNMLFFNRAVLEKAGVSIPEEGYTWDRFVEDLRTLKTAGATPVCLGGKDAFTTANLFENILLADIGTEGWAAIQRDRFDWSGDQVGSALQKFDTVLGYSDPEAATLTWDEAAKKLAAGECAFDSVNDSTYAELTRTGAVDNRDFGEVPFPGTDGTYVAVVDTFVQSSAAQNAVNATQFLEVVAGRDAQAEFSRLKGSVPARTDVDPAGLSDYQRRAYQSYTSDTVLWSIVYGEATNAVFQQGFFDGVSAYVQTRDKAAFSRAIVDAVSGGGAPAK